MVIAIYILIVLSSATQSASTKVFNRDCSYSSVFNAIKSYAALFIFALIAAFHFEFHFPTLVFGCLYGTCLSISMYAGYQALCYGPMALTSMLVSFSVVVPLIWGVTAGDETLKQLQYLALVLSFLLLF